MINKHVISKKQAVQLKPYLKYMDFGNVRLDRRHIVENLMFKNMMLGNIKTSFIDDLLTNYIKAHPDAELPDILRINI